MLDWSWAEDRLVSSKNYWVGTVWPDNRPHIMAVWAVWHDGGLWFSSSKPSRKIQNLSQNPNCVVTTDNPWEPVVLDGTAEVITEMEQIAAFLENTNRKYDTNYAVDFLDPAVNSTVRVAPRWVFSLTEDDFGGSPTKWVFET
jgi:nitroimidazol reductase NimA-like FMN-containing flavoprotein (pyridoxamine 5'-phosphate oxidase superfamily)